ncbi:motility associated factor glycosyltransferase family protein [Campylobacter sp. TTU_617]|uniref:motility associated factor glycosyltransferase family protein n=1 Tax=Campylobacter sp. TTU_617 TaxID=2768148 RepID=UPI0019059225|nr:motility associated factor glycosyltransferase family protein [Campylobacter sp. TTU_617]MBK1972423.1 motility associated factor glycosyltransferase family protein [Campylobacter sp. TTU_617]
MDGAKIDLFKKNIDALVGSNYIDLKKKLQNIKELKKFNYFLNKDPLDINITRKSDLKTIFKNPKEELEDKIKTFKEFARYPFFFFYGLGNGIFFKALLQNDLHKRIIVFEAELEIIYLVFHWIDFDLELRQGRFIIMHSKEMDYVKADILCSLPQINISFKLYDLKITCEFYEKYYKEDIEKMNDLLMKAITNIALRQGNDPKDTMIGIEQAIYNLPKVFTHPSYDELKQKRFNKNKASAIIVGTGPSLTKQLPLLKKYQNKAIIFCADSAYAILAKEDIKPDYVCMLERDEIVSECFNNDFGDFDKDILFILASVVSKKTIDYLEKNHRKYMLIARASTYTNYLDLSSFGYIGGGMSVSHMACELALRLGFKNIILIGQDLAYAKDGSHHSKGFIHDDYHIGDYERDFNRYTTMAYGGKGIVQSSKVWILFKQIFENFCAANSYAKIYNCTEGGARIEGSIEKPFKEVCEEFFTKELKKPLVKLKNPSKEQRNHLMLENYKRVKKSITMGENFLKHCKKIDKRIKKFIYTSKGKYSLNELVDELDLIKEKLNKKKYIHLSNVLSSLLYHHNLLSSKLYVQNVSNESDKQNKLLAWIYSHESWLEDIIDIFGVQNQRLKQAIIPLQDILEKKNLI